MTSQPTYQHLEFLDQLHDNYRKVFVINNLDLILLQHQGTLHLLENVCPHAGYLLTEAKLVGTTLRCPMHGYLFEIADGACTAHYEGSCRGLHTYALHYLDDEVGVLL